MDTENIYYCYVYKREDGTPYYIGKGKGSRAFISNGRITNPPRDRTNIFFACEGVSETEAFEMEVALVSLLGRKDLGTGILRNQTGGGEGASGLSHSEESKRKMSERLKGKSRTEESKRKMSERKKGQPNGRLGITHTEESRSKMSDSHKGKPHSEETKRKISESRKRYWERRRREEE